MARTLTRGQLKTRMLRALSGLSQEDFERETQVENIAGIESGSRHADASQVARMCPSAGLTPESCEALLQDYEARVAHAANRAAIARIAHIVDTAKHRVPRPERPDPEHAAGIAGIIEAFEARIGRHGEERSARRAAEREQARISWDRAKGLSFEDVALLARTTREYQSWALVELICDESAQTVSMRGDQGSAERARDLAGLAVEIAGRVRGSESWCRRLRGFAMAHLASVQHAAGDPDTARKTFAEAERLWESGENPDQVLDESRFTGLKASLTARQGCPS